MKSSIQYNKKVFSPFELVVRVETIEDLLCLWHRFNINKIDNSSTAMGRTFNEVAEPYGKRDTWLKLDNIIKDLEESDE